MLSEGIFHLYTNSTPFLQLLQQKILKRLFVGQLQHIGRNEEVVIHAGEFSGLALMPALTYRLVLI